MEENLRVVPIGEIVVSSHSGDVLVAYGLGSCVSVCLYDPLARVGGMLHALLPSANGTRGSSHPAKFVNRGVPLLVDALLELGARRFRLRATLCGGAQMLHGPAFDNRFNIGRHNILAAEEALELAKIRVRAIAAGGRQGRTVKLYLSDGRVTVRTLDQGEQVLT